MAANRVPDIYLVEERIYWDGNKPMSYWGWRLSCDDESETCTFFSTRACLEEFERLVSEWAKRCDHRMAAILLSAYLGESMGSDLINDETFVVSDELREKVWDHLENYKHGEYRNELANG